MEHYVNDYKVNNLKKIIESIEYLRKDNLTIEQYQYITKKSPDKYSYLFRHYKSTEGLKIISNNEHEFLISLEDNLDDKVEDRLSSVPLPPPELPGENERKLGNTKILLNKINSWLEGLKPDIKVILKDILQEIDNANYKSKWKGYISSYSRSQISSLNLVIEMEHKEIIQEIFKLIDERIDELLNKESLDEFIEMMKDTSENLDYSNYLEESDNIYKNIRILYKLKKSFFLDIKNIYSEDEINKKIDDLDAKIKLITQICIECSKKLQNNSLRSKEKEVCEKICEKPGRSVKTFGRKKKGYLDGMTQQILTLNPEDEVRTIGESQDTDDESGDDGSGDDKESFFTRLFRINRGSDSDSEEESGDDGSGDEDDDDRERKERRRRQIEERRKDKDDEESYFSKFRNLFGRKGDEDSDEVKDKKEFKKNDEVVIKVKYRTEEYFINGVILEVLDGGMYKVKNNFSRKVTTEFKNNIFTIEQVNEQANNLINVLEKEIDTIRDNIDEINNKKSNIDKIYQKQEYTKENLSEVEKLINEYNTSIQRTKIKFSQSKKKYNILKKKFKYYDNDEVTSKLSEISEKLENITYSLNENISNERYLNNNKNKFSSNVNRKIAEDERQKKSEERKIQEDAKREERKQRENEKREMENAQREERKQRENEKREIENAQREERKQRENEKREMENAQREERKSRNSGNIMDPRKDREQRERGDQEERNNQREREQGERRDPGNIVGPEQERMNPDIKGEIGQEREFGKMDIRGDKVVKESAIDRKLRLIEEEARLENKMRDVEIDVNRNIVPIDDINKGELVEYEDKKRKKKRKKKKYGINNLEINIDYKDKIDKNIERLKQKDELVFREDNIHLDKKLKEYNKDGLLFKKGIYPEIENLSLFIVNMSAKEKQKLFTMVKNHYLYNTPELKNYLKSLKENELENILNFILNLDDLCINNKKYINIVLNKLDKLEDTGYKSIKRKKKSKKKKKKKSN